MKSISIVPIEPSVQPFIKSLWPSRVSSKVRPRLLPFQFGDGKKDVLVSFYHAPDIVILVKFDSSLPLDLPDPERFEISDEIRSFRDVMNDVYELCEDHVKIRRSWSKIRDAGATWCNA